MITASDWMRVADEFCITTDQAIYYFSEYQETVIALLEGEDEAWESLYHVLLDYRGEILAGTITSEDDKCLTRS